MDSINTIEDMRIEFDREGGRTLAFPIAGTFAWTATAIFGFFWPAEKASFALFICNGMIFPISLVLAHYLKEKVLSAKNPLDNLFGQSILMVNLLWTLAIPFWMVMPSSLPLTAGIMAGLHWIVYGWIVNHWIGLFHTIARTVLIIVSWFLFPDHRFVVVPLVIVAMYLITIYILATRPLANQPNDKMVGPNPS